MTQMNFRTRCSKNRVLIQKEETKKKRLVWNLKLDSEQDKFNPQKIPANFSKISVRIMNI